VKKIAQNVSAAYFYPISVHNFYVGKKVVQILWAASVIFKKLPKEKNAQEAKMRPKWSPWPLARRKISRKRNVGA
jgi:hypothetical protein